jgi:hypothetical protein
MNSSVRRVDEAIPDAEEFRTLAKLVALDSRNALTVMYVLLDHLTKNTAVRLDKNILRQLTPRPLGGRRIPSRHETLAIKRRRGRL